MEEISHAKCLVYWKIIGGLKGVWYKVSPGYLTFQRPGAN